MGSLLNWWIIVTLYFVCAFTKAVDVQKSQALIIPCPLDIQYPTWTGPEGLANPLTDGQTINEPGIKWIKNKDLLIEKTLLKHNGNFTCSDGNGNSSTVEVAVQSNWYLSAWGEFTPATVENTTTVLTCWCVANPTCKIIPHLYSHIRPGQEVNHNSTITFKPCVPDPENNNMSRCSLEAVMHVSKEDNGLEMSCAVEYQNTTVVTLYPRVIVKFHPTVVNISAELKQSKLILNCSTDSSNPVSSLTWRRGSSDELYASDIIRSGYKSYVMDAEYNGKNITQAIDIEPEKIQKGEKVFCCTQHNNKQICDSIALESYQISGAGVVTAWLTVLFVGVAFLAV